MAAPLATSLRGLTVQYFFYVDPWFERPAGSFTKDVDIAGEGEIEEVAIYPNGCFANVQWVYTIQEGPTVQDSDERLCMTYNPITDGYAIREGEYVL